MDFLELKKKVLKKTPYLSRTLNKKGDTTLLTYFEKNLNFSCTQNKARQEELLSVIKKCIIKIIDPTIADEATEQLRNTYYASTADHHGPITHPFFVNSHLAQSYANQQHGKKNIFVFSCSGISLNNSSHPRGILFHDKNLNKQRINFVSLKHRHHPVYAFPAYTLRDIEKKLSTRTNEKIIQKLIHEVYENTSVLNKDDYANQVTYSNYLLWKKIPGQEQMNLIYLEQEKIVSKLLIEYHLGKTTFLSQLLTDEVFLTTFEKYFDGIQGAFSSAEKKGTVLFWAIHEGQRQQLMRQKKVLRTNDGSYQIELTAENIREALKKRKLMPSMATSFIVLSFYYGLTCGGGFLQVNYLTYMKEAYICFLKDLQLTEEIQKVEQIETSYFCGEFVFSRIGNKDRTAHASSIDLILYGDRGMENRLQELARVCTLGEAIDMMMPQFYKILYGKEPEIALPPAHFPPTLYVS